MSWYNSTTGTALRGFLDTTDPVTIKIVDDADNLLSLTTDVCTQSLHIPGLFYFHTGNIITALSENTSYTYLMTDGTLRAGGKFTIKDFLPANIKQVNDVAVVSIDDFKASSVDLQPVLDAISALNDLALSDIEGSAIIAKEATLALVQSAVANLNDITAIEVRAAFDATDFKDKNTEAEIHAWLDSYANKDDYKADVSNLSADVNVIEVNGITITSIDEFKASPTEIADAVWNKTLP